MCFKLGDAGGTAGPVLRSRPDSQRRQSAPQPPISQSHPIARQRSTLDVFSCSPARPLPAAYRLPRRGGRRCDRHDLGARRVRQQRWLDRRGGAAAAATTRAPAGRSTGSGSCPRPGTRSPRARAGTCTPSASSTRRSPRSTPRARSQAGLASSWKYAARRQERHLHAPARPEVLRRVAAHRDLRQAEHQARPDPGELDRRLRALGHLQGGREQPDQLHPGPDPGRLPGARPARGQGRHDRQPGRLQQGRIPRHPAGGRRAVHADVVRARLAREPGAQPRLLGRQPDPHRELQRARHHPARADPLGPRVGPGQRRLHRGQPGRGGQGGRVQDRRDPVRGGRRARHPDDDRAVQQPGRGAGDQLRDRPAGHPAGAGVGLRVGLLPAVPGRVRRLQLEARQRVPVQPRPWPSSCSPRPGTRRA